MSEYARALVWFRRDFDYAVNNGGFNPVTQSGRDYPAPIVDHATQRTGVLEIFKFAAVLP